MTFPRHFGLPHNDSPSEANLRAYEEAIGCVLLAVAVVAGVMGAGLLALWWWL